MTIRFTILAVVLTMGLSGCARVSESRLNPFNWFGSAEDEPVAAASLEDDDPRPRVAQITSLRIDETPTGAIIRATGLPPTQGYFDAQLIPQTDDPVNGELVLVFRADVPIGEPRVSTVQSRELVAARAISVQDLAALRVVRVEGATNALSVRR